jgi:hypothetical protein
MAGFRDRPLAGGVRVTVSDVTGSEWIITQAAATEVEGDCIPRVAAGHRLTQLAGEEAQTLAVKYQLVSEHTSMVVVAERDEKAGQLPTVVPVPHMLVEAELRYAAACPAPAVRTRRPSSSWPDAEDALACVADVGEPDAIAAADVCISLDLHDDAAQLLQAAIELEPERRDLRLKLLEACFAAGKVDEFLEIAQWLEQTRDRAAPGEWERIVIQGRQLAPHHPLFGDIGLADGSAGVGGAALLQLLSERLRAGGELPHTLEELQACGVPRPVIDELKLLQSTVLEDEATLVRAFFAILADELGAEPALVDALGSDVLHERQHRELRGRLRIVVNLMRG